MGHSQADKAKSRERILREAAAQIRDQGLESLSVGPLMRRVDLTHGGFYGHFGSRAELLAQALAQALRDNEADSAFTRGLKGPSDYPLSLRRYLSRQHRDDRAGGCALAALLADVARSDDLAARATAAEHLQRMAQRLAAALGGDADKGWFAASALVGALLVARALPDRRQSDAVLAAARQQLLALAEPSDPGPATAP